MNSQIPDKTQNLRFHLLQVDWCDGEKVLWLKKETVEYKGKMGGERENSSGVTSTQRYYSDGYLNSWPTAVRTGLHTLSLSFPLLSPQQKKRDFCRLPKGPWRCDPEWHKHTSMFLYVMYVQTSCLKLSLLALIIDFGLKFRIKPKSFIFVCFHWPLKVLIHWKPQTLVLDTHK